MTPGGAQEMTIINESGIYSLVFGSKLPTAKNLNKREHELRILHHLQVKYIKEWRVLKEEEPERAEKILTKLLSLINSISSGLKSTG